MFEQLSSFFIVNFESNCFSLFEFAQIFDNFCLAPPFYFQRWKAKSIKWMNDIGLPLVHCNIDNMVGMVWFAGIMLELQSADTLQLQQQLKTDRSEYC